MQRGDLSPGVVVDAAIAMIERDGADRFGMRRLAAEFGVSVSTIYWHVGNLDGLLDAVIARAGERFERFEVIGSTPHERVMAVARQIWITARDHHELSSLAYRRGRTGALALPLQRILARELSAAGLRGAHGADVLRGILYAVGGFIVIAFRSPESMPPERRVERLWERTEDELIDPSVLVQLAHAPDLDPLFESTIGALVAALVPG